MALSGEPAQPGSDGRLYQRVEHAGGTSYMPADELLPHEAAKPPPSSFPPEPARWTRASETDAALLAAHGWSGFAHLF